MALFVAFGGVIRICFKAFVYFARFGDRYYTYIYIYINSSFLINFLLQKWELLCVLYLVGGIYNSILVEE